MTWGVRVGIFDGAVLVGLAGVAACCTQSVVAAQVCIPLGQFLLFGQIVERCRQAVGTVLFWDTAQCPQGGLQTGGQSQEAFARVDDADMAPTRIGQCKLVQAVSKNCARNLHVELVCHGEVRNTLAPWRVFLGEVDLPLLPKLGAPQAYAALQGPQHAGVPPAGVATLEFFEQGDGVEPGIGL